MRVKAGNTQSEEVRTLELPIGFTITENDGHVTASTGGSMPLNPLGYGAVGDGVTDDSDALRTLLALGQNISLPHGYTFLTSKPLLMTIAKQRVIGFGGKIKRRSQWSTTLSVAITGGAGASFTVASATNIKVGQQITIYDNASTYEFSTLNAPRTVVSVVGNVVTVDGTITNSFSIGATVYLAGFVFDVSAADVVIEGIEIDGNNAGWTFGRWQISAEINTSAGSDRFTLRDSYLHDGASDAVLNCDASACRFERNKLLNFQGNGIHTGSELGNPGIVGCRIAFNHIENCNLNAALPHSDGCVVLSSVVADTLVHGNYLKAGLCGVGSVNSTDNSNITISDNEIRNMTRAAIDGLNSGTTCAQNVVIEGNRIYSSVALNIQQSTNYVATVLPTRHIIQGNYLYQTPIILTITDKFVITGNICDGGSDTTMKLIQILGAKRTMVKDNLCLGGDYGIYYKEPAGLNGAPVAELPFGEGILIDGNTCHGQHTRGIHVGTDSIDASGVTNNIVIGDSTAVAGYVGIQGAGALDVRGNNVKVVVGTAGIKLTGLNSSAKQNKVKVGSSGAFSIRVDPSAYFTIVRDNETDVAVSDGGTSSVIGTTPTNAVLVTPNLVANPSFEVDTTGWAASGVGFLNAGATFARILTAPFSGVGCLQVDTTASPASQGVFSRFGPSNKQFNAESAYTVSVYLKGNVGGEVVTVVYGDSALGTVTLDCTLTTAWQRFSGVIFQGVIADGTNASVGIRGKNAAAIRFFVDAVQVTQTRFAVTYSDT